jgi:hypothetical protein
VSGNNTANTVSVLLGNGDGTFGSAVSYASGQTVNSVAVADFDGDSRLDIAAAHFQGHDISVLLGQGDGTFASPVKFPVGLSPVGLLAADFNGDGRPDLAVASLQDRDVSVLLNTWP